ATGRRGRAGHDDALEIRRPSVPAVDWSDREGERIDLEALPDGVRAGGVSLRFLDEPDVGDLYNFCWAIEGQTPSGPDGVQVEAERFDVGWDGLRVAGRVRRQGAVLRLHGVIHNRRKDHRLRLHVGLPRSTETVVAGAPFELVERPLVGEGGEGEAPSPTWPARHVVIASNVAVLHEGVFEY